MPTKSLLAIENLEERFKNLVLNRLESHHLSEAQRRHIRKKFANKSLQELQEIVQQLDVLST